MGGDVQVVEFQLPHGRQLHLAADIVGQRPGDDERGGRVFPLQRNDRHLARGVHQLVPHAQQFHHHRQDEAAEALVGARPGCVLVQRKQWARNLFSASWRRQPEQPTRVLAAEELLRIWHLVLRFQFRHQFERHSGQVLCRPPLVSGRIECPRKLEYFQREYQLAHPKRRIGSGSEQEVPVRLCLRSARKVEGHCHHEAGFLVEERPDDQRGI